MKNTILALALSFAFVAPAFAYNGPIPAGCNIPPDHAVWSSDALTIVGCIKDSAWQAGMAEQQYGTGNLPYVAPGQTITDAHGIKDTCPVSYFHGCVDPTKTVGYNTYMTTNIKTVVAYYGSPARAIAEFPTLAGWINALFPSIK